MKNRYLFSIIVFIICAQLVFSSFIGTGFQGHLIDQSSSIVQQAPTTPFDNIILMIGDGMSWGQINATKKWLGTTATLTIEELTYLGDIETSSLNSLVTDSSAAATALATGFRTDNGMVAMLPTGDPLSTILEVAEGLGKATGLVTTSPITHGTPAAFSAHVLDRNNQDEIAQQQIVQGIEVLLGGGMRYYSSLLGTVESLGYHIVQNRTDMIAGVNEEYLLGLFANEQMSYEYDHNPLVEPHISEMTNIALQILNREANGFFMMIEGALIDYASHNMNINRTIGETIAFDEAVQVVYEYAQQTARTLLIVTGDHETGGLWVNMSTPTLEYHFSTTIHTAAPVPVFVYHNTAAALPTFTHHIDIGQYLFSIIGQVTPPPINPVILGFVITLIVVIIILAAALGAHFRRRTTKP
ncbi:MAG: alkaline phosphatase [Candidatus Hermodarchaeia archaeon]|jgi:alkaline phosphatase